VLQVSEAHEEIRNLLGLYCERMDAGDWDGLGELFADASLVNDEGIAIAAGRDGVRRLYGLTKTYDGSPRTRHLTTNSVIDVDEVGGTASARSAYVVFQEAPSLPLQPIITGRYRDRFRRGDDGAWRFAERSFSVDLVGDLSHHLPYEVPQ